MKFELTIREASEILAKVAKAEEKVEAFFKAEAEYDRISGLADDYFKEHDTYSIAAIDARMAARERRENACRVAFNAIIVAAQTMEPSSSDYRWEQICNNAKKRYSHNIRETLVALKSMMVEQIRFFVK